MDFLLVHQKKTHNLHWLQIWDLADTTRGGNLSEAEFCIAMHLVASAMKGIELPSVLPIELKTIQGQLRQVYYFCNHYIKYFSL